MFDPIKSLPFFPMTTLAVAMDSVLGLFTRLLLSSLCKGNTEMSPLPAERRQLLSGLFAMYTGKLEVYGKAPEPVSVLDYS